MDSAVADDHGDKPTEREDYRYEDEEEAEEDHTAPA